MCVQQNRPNLLEKIRSFIESVTAIDNIGATHKQSPSPRRQSQGEWYRPGVVIQFFANSKEGLYSVIYEPRHFRKLRLRFSQFLDGRNFPNVSSLDDFAQDYCDELALRGVDYSNESVMLGQDLTEGVMYRQIYHGTPQGLDTKVREVLELLIEKYIG